MAQGFSQKPGEDYFETYAPVMCTESFKIACTIAAHEDLEADTCDIVGAYLNSELKEDIYMKQPPGFDDGTGRVWRLHKALYGLKQAGKAWNDKFNDVLTNILGFTRSHSDPCLYFKFVDKIIILVIHVDDTTMFGTRKALDQVKADLREHFQLTDLGPLRSFLGFQVERDRDLRTIKLHQARYLQIVLERFGMQNCTPVATPLDHNVKLIPLDTDASPDEITDAPYAIAIGSLMYAATGTRPDISFAVQHLAQFTSRPSHAHWTAVKRVMRYIKGTASLGITLGGNPLSLKGYCDADWGANPSDRRSISGYLFKFGDGPVSWSSKKQQSVALFTMEAEYYALGHATKEALWLHSLLGELGYASDPCTTLITDNQSAIDFAYSTQFHSRAKHIDIRHYFIRELIEDGRIDIIHCSSADNCADMLTKALAKPTHIKQLTLANLSAH